MNTQLIWNLILKGMMGTRSRSYPHGVPKVSTFTHRNKLTIKVVSKPLLGLTTLNQALIRTPTPNLMGVIWSESMISQAFQACYSVEGCKGTSRVMLSQDWGSVLLVARWQYVYAFPPFLSSLCLCHAGDAFYLLLGHCDYWSMCSCDSACDRLV